MSPKDTFSQRKLTMSLAKRSYLWNMIHCDTVTMLSCVSFKVDSFALRASSENDMVTAFDRDLRPQFVIVQPVFVCCAVHKNGHQCPVARDWSYVAGKLQ
jgi:hypothetical protein